MKTKKYDRVDFPAYAICEWEYGDGDMNAEDSNNLDNWRNEIEAEIKSSFPGSTGFFLSFGNEQFFSSRPAFGLPCDCVEAEVIALFE